MYFQSRQKCICDTEHMFNCPDNGMTGGEADEDNEVDNGPSQVKLRSHERLKLAAFEISFILVNDQYNPLDN